MKKIFILLPAWLLLAPVFASAQVTEEEQAFAQQCRDNVNAEKGRLSADTALECVRRLTGDNNEFLTRLRDQSPELGAAAADILSLNGALIDLKDIVTQSNGRGMSRHLRRVLEEYPCPLCAMGLGPRPEKIFDWVGKEAGLAVVDVQRSVRTWESLGEIRTRSLSSAAYGYDPKRWNAKNITGRFRALSQWAEKETDKLAAIYGGSYLGGSFTDNKPDPRLIEVLREDFDAMNNVKYLAKLDELRVRLGMIGEGKDAFFAPVTAGKKAAKIAASLKNVAGLKDKTPAQQAAYLNGLFDQTAPNTGGVTAAGAGAAAARKSGFVYRRLSEEQIAKLPGRLVTAGSDGSLRGPFADEMRGTKAGDEILAFYRDPEYAKTGANSLGFGFAKMPDRMLGGWNAGTKKIDLNSQLINNWLRKNGVRPEQLFEGEPSDNPHLKKLSRYLVPTFVHEATHQRQTAQAAAAGVDYLVFRDGVRAAPYQMEMETEAFAMDNAFMAEQLMKRGLAYGDDLCPFDKMNITVFLEEGVEGVRWSNHKAYKRLESVEGVIAKDLAWSAPTVNELAGLEAEDPGIMEEAELKQKADLRGEMDSRFKWYATASADSAKVEAKINGWRSEISARLYPMVAAKAPPEPL